MASEQELKTCVALFFPFENPKKPGSKAYERYEQYKHALTYQEFLEYGGTAGDWASACKKGIVGRLQDQDFSECAYHKNFKCSPCVEEDFPEIFKDTIPSPKVVEKPTEDGKCYARVWCQVVGLDKDERINEDKPVRYVSLPYCRCKNKVMKGGEYCKTHTKRFEENTLTMGDIRDEPQDFIGFTSRRKRHAFVGYGSLNEYDPDHAEWKSDESEGKWIWKPEQWRKRKGEWFSGEEEE